ncbi:hypothetical protein KIN20_032756 [Parelaphostrongylus tenuis]|uniref:Uncharacterized protein n=1 Tax=Parelaphostrongylus tenuis TaxID=148309 RepID=A0AAD5R7A0_PARTN|nr:hypothetical protein KIN20_032756 [Parelaphostrongylus tenuis]
MALKRIKKTKSSVIEDDAVENEPTTFIDPIRPNVHQLDYRIMNHPSLRMREIIELGSAGTMADLSETLSSASDWLQKQKAKMKEFLGRMDGVKTLPKTPNRGKTFANVRNTAQLFRSTLPLAEICDNSSNRLWPTFSRVKNGDDEATDRHEDEPPSKVTGTENQWKGEEVNEERETIRCEEVKNPEQPVQYSGYISDEYVSATESSEQRPHVKMECESPTTVAGPEGVPVLTQTPKIRVKVTRSVAKEKAAEVERLGGQPVRSKRLREQQLLSTVAAVRKEMINRAVAGHSQTRLQRPGHQHVVTTPCKREYKDAVLRVVNEQDLMRNSGDRKVLPTPSRLNRAVPKAPLGALANPRTPYDPHSKEEAEALWRKKEEVAAQLREEQRKERAERARKEREEKALKAQRRRELKELEEKLKAQARRQKEIRDERRREELRLQKSPSRCKFASSSRKSCESKRFVPLHTRPCSCEIGKNLVQSWRRSYERAYEEYTFARV